MKCKLCNKTLVPIGTARVNGKQHHSDWDTRCYHKKCWQLRLLEIDIKRSLKMNEN